MAEFLHGLGNALGRLAGHPLDLFLLLLLMAAATAWVWLAARASAQAERDGRSPAGHFLLGLIVPFAWAFVMPRGGVGTAATPVLAEPVPEIPAGKRSLRLPATAQETPAAEPVAAEAENEEPAGAAPQPAGIPTVEGTVGPEYFLELIRSRAVTLETPCLIRRDDGTQVTAVGVVEAKTELVVVKFRAADGSLQNIRVPYARIRRIEPLPGET